MPTGQMMKWNSEKGFGFIRPDDGGEDMFCHASGLVDGDGSVHDGDDVSFKVEYDERKGKDRATKVTSLGSGGGGGGGGGGRKRDDSRDRGRGGGGRSRTPPRRSGGGGGGSRGGGGGGGGRGGGPGTGTMMSWQAEKGFGFIKPDKGDEDLFCHVSELLDGEGSVGDGDKVSFVEIYDERKGKMRATQVKSEGGGGRGGGGRSGGGGGGRRNDSRSPPPRRGGGRRDDSRGR